MVDNDSPLNKNDVITLISLDSEVRCSLADSLGSLSITTPMCSCKTRKKCLLQYLMPHCRMDWSKITWKTKLVENSPKEGWTYFSGSRAIYCLVSELSYQHFHSQGWWNRFIVVFWHHCHDDDYTKLHISAIYGSGSSKFLQLIDVTVAISSAFCRSSLTKVQSHPA